MPWRITLTTSRTVKETRSGAKAWVVAVYAAGGATLADQHGEGVIVDGE